MVYNVRIIHGKILMTYSRQELASLGKRASDLYRSQGMQLGDAIVKVASTERGLTPEHVTRITENANLITFEEMFKEADSKHIVFDLADPVEVNQRIHRSDAEKMRPSSVYFSPPSYDGAPETDTFERIPLEKESSYMDINHDYEDVQHMVKLNSALGHIESELNRLDSEAQYATYMLAEMVKSAAVQCNAIYPPLQIMGALVEDQVIFEKVSNVVVQMLPDIPRGEYVNRAPNYNHPIAAQYVKVEDLTKEAGRHMRGLQKLNTEKEKILSQNRLLGVQ
jgi:hypothetical protein